MRLKNKYSILLVAGARPNFMKIAPIIRALSSPQLKTLLCPSGINKAGLMPITKIVYKLVHTGQHYDYEMSEAFLNDLEIPKPEYYLESGSGSRAEQTARIMVGFEKVCNQCRADMVMVVGDINSTLACSVVAKKNGN